MIEQSRLDDLWDFADPAASERRLRGAAEDAAAADRAELLTQVARSRGLQGDFDAAHALLATIGENAAAVVRVRALLESGRLVNSSGNPNAALAYFRDAAAIAREHGLTFLEVDALHMLAIVDDPPRWSTEALAVLDRGGDARTQRWRVSLHNNLGWHYLDRNSTEQAHREFTQALTDAHRYGTAQQIQWAEEALDECRDAMGT